MQSIYGPPEDGAIAVNHAAVAPNRTVRPWKPSLGGPDAQGRFFAKGFFASKLVRNGASTPSCTSIRFLVAPTISAIGSEASSNRHSF